jgi:hypothetical protein
MKVLTSALPLVLLSLATLSCADRPSWLPKGDPSARSWLPTAVSARPEGDSASAPVDTFLQSLSGHIRPMVCWYHGNRLGASRAFKNGELTAENQRWACGMQAVRDKGDPTALDLRLSFRLVEGEVRSAGVAVAFDFSSWSTKNYVLAPASLYNGNRFRVLPVKWPAYIYDEKDRPLDMPITQTDVPHLNVNGDPAKVEMLTGNCATPMLSFFDPQSKRGFIFLAEQGTRFGNSGLFVQEDASRKQLSLVVSAPGVREQRYVGCGRADSGDTPADWKTGEGVTLKLRLYNFETTDISAFMAKVFEVRKALSGPNEYRNLAPFSAIANLIIRRHDATSWFENEKFGYICARPGGNSPFGHIQVGWGGVPVFGYPEVILENLERLRRVGRSFDTVAENMRGKSGLLYAMFRKGELLGDNFEQMEQKRSISLIRRSGKALYMMIQQLELLRQRGHNDMIKPAWETMLRGISDGLVRLWDANGQFGQFVDVEAGQIEVTGSTTGSFCISGLALASQYFHEPKYLEVAEKAGKLYYERDLRHGYSGGGPSEILQCPDSESAYGLVEAYTALYELTGIRDWIEYACDAVHLLSTWVVSYDYKFPPESDLGRVDAKAAGSVWASVQNEHSAPGLYISSGSFLLKLFRATGDKRIAEMYKDIVHNVIQYVNTPGNPVIRDGAFGAVSERVNLSDWEGKDNIGMIPRGDSGMSWETAAALTCLLNPGIYLHTDDDTLLVLDHVDARILRRSRNGVTLEITNPTAYYASVSVLAETAKMSRKPLGWNAYEKWPRVPVKAGSIVQVLAKSDGTLHISKSIARNLDY